MLITSQWPTGLLLLTLAAAVIYWASRRDPHWQWWECTIMGIGCLFWAVVLIDMTALVLTVISTVLSCWRRQALPSHDQGLLVCALFVGALNGILAEALGEYACDAWYKSKQKAWAVAAFAPAFCTAAAALMLLGAAWLSIETIYFGLPTGAGLSDGLFLLGVSPVGASLLLIIAPSLKEAGKKLLARLSRTAIKLRRKVFRKRRLRAVVPPRGSQSR